MARQAWAKRPDAPPRDRGSRWKALRLRILRAHPLCVMCEAQGRTRAAHEIDHVIPLSKGGTDTVANLQGLCIEHHRDKTLRDKGHEPRRAFGPDGEPLDGWDR